MSDVYYIKSHSWQTIATKGVQTLDMSRIWWFLKISAMSQNWTSDMSRVWDIVYEMELLWGYLTAANILATTATNTHPQYSSRLENLNILLKKMVQTWKWYFWDQHISRDNLAWVWHFVPSALDFTSMGLRNFLGLSHFYYNEFWADGTRSKTHAKLILLMSWFQKHLFQVCTIFLSKMFKFSSGVPLCTIMHSSVFLQA